MEKHLDVVMTEQMKMKRRFSRKDIVALVSGPDAEALLVHVRGGLETRGGSFHHVQTSPTPPGGLSHKLRLY